MFIKAVDLAKSNPIYRFSNPVEAQRQAHRYLGKRAVLYRSTNSQKKYMVLDPNDKIVHFGQMGYEDYTKHLNKDRRKNYLTRSANIAGDWKKNKYSPNNLAREILW
jgi:hypothetical protein